MSDTISLLYPPDFDFSKSVSMKDYGFIKPLQIDEMIVLARDSYRGFTDLPLQDFFTTDTEVLEYRLAVVEDLVNEDVLYDTFCKAVQIIFNLSDIRKALSGNYTVDSALSSVRHLEMYIEIVELFANMFHKCNPKSKGMNLFRDTVLGIEEGADFQNLKRELEKTEVEFGQIKSATIGINFDYNLQPYSSGIVSVNTEPFYEGTLMDKLLRRRKSEYQVMSALFPVERGLHGEELRALNLSMGNALHSIFSRALKDFEPTIQKYYNSNTTLFIKLLDDIRFLTAGVKFIREMQSKGFSMCRPKIAPVSEKRCELKNVYNPVLAGSQIENTIVANSFSYDEQGRFYLVTGPNHGGKSIFAYSIGMAQALFQLGLFVPAEEAFMSPVTGIFTHFPSSDENNYGKGRLESECARLSKIMKMLDDTDLLLMDESFSSTSGLEASYIATEVLTGIGVIGCGGIYVTHIHDLSQKLEVYNTYEGNKGKIDNLVAQMENTETGARSYKITRTTPDGLSYARDIATRYGLDLTGILENRENGSNNVNNVNNTVNGAG